MNALFIGWGGTHAGRERFALEHFAEWGEILTKLKAEGEIEGFETVELQPHGGELDGFTLVYGAPEKLSLLFARDDLHRLRMRAALDHAKFSVIWAATGESVEREFALFEEVLSEYEREPALVA